MIKLRKDLSKQYLTRLKKYLILFISNAIFGYITGFFMYSINEKLLDTLYTPIIIADSNHELVFYNKAFARFSKQVDVEYDEILAFVKVNLKKNQKRMTSVFAIPDKQVHIHAEKVEDLVVIHIEIIRQNLINHIRREIINQFSASLSHIFYNLITIIKNNLEKEKEKCFNRTINESIDRIQKIVDIVNLYSSNISGYLHTKDYSLNKVIEEALNKNKPIWDSQAKLKKIKFEIIKKLSKDYIINGSYDDMLMAFTHIIKNALEAMMIKKGGVLSIETFERKKGFVDIVISDTGIGLTWQDRERVFEPFFTTKKLKRKGLGLSYAYGIVRRHHGNIKFESKKNTGSKVTVSLPYKQINKSTAINSNFKSHSLKSKNQKPIKKILLIDDEKLIVNTTAKILEKLSDYQVLKANSGNEGIALFTQNYNEIDLIISDLGMDEVSGFDVASFIFKYSDEKNIKPPKFILYTGWGNHVTQEELKKFHITAVYNKPLSPEDFRTILENLKD